MLSICKGTLTHESPVLHFTKFQPFLLFISLQRDHAATLVRHFFALEKIGVRSSVERSCSTLSSSFTAMLQTTEIKQENAKVSGLWKKQWETRRNFSITQR